MGGKMYGWMEEWVYRQIDVQLDWLDRSKDYWMEGWRNNGGMFRSASFV